MPTLALQDFAERVAKGTRQNLPICRELIIAFDPGETTGFCAMLDCKVLELCQIDTGLEVPDAFGNLKAIFDKYSAMPEWAEAYVVFENYRIYSWKSDAHQWSAVHTVKIVGFVQVLANMYKKEAHHRMASVAKNFMDDSKLKMLGLYDVSKGQKHARDALRHAALQVIFPMPKSEFGKDKRPDKQSTNTST